jgi:hypothetical protein
MKKVILIVTIIAVPLLLLGAVEVTFPCPGTYDVQQVTLKFKDIFKKKSITHWKSAHIVESKPTDLTVEPPIEKIKGIRYASVRLGNNEKDTWLVMGQDDAGYYSEIYLDQNLDNNITTKEKIADIDTFQVEDKGFTINIGRVYPKPIPLLVSYKGSKGEIRKKLYFYLQSEIALKKKTDTLFLSFINATALEGKITVKWFGGRNDSRVRLVDANSNGCFNDYNKDCIFMDLNAYEKSDANKKSINVLSPLYEYFNIKEKSKIKQMRLVVLPYPAKVSVIEATEEFDPVQLEPESDQFDIDKENKPGQDKEKLDKDKSDKQDDESGDENDQASSDEE